MDIESLGKAGYTTWKFTKYPALVSLIAVAGCVGAAFIGELNPDFYTATFPKDVWVEEVATPLTYVGGALVLAATAGYVVWRFQDYDYFEWQKVTDVGSKKH